MEPEAVLQSTYVSIFELARENACASISIPAISCGAYGFPVDKAAAIAIAVSAQYPDIDVKFYLMGNKVVEAWRYALSTA